MADDDILSDIGPYSIRRREVFVKIAEKLKNRSSGQLEAFLDEIIARKDSIHKFNSFKHLRTKISNLP